MNLRPVSLFPTGSYACAYALLLMPTASAQIAFEDVSSPAGFHNEGESWGAAWGDVNGDGWPDLWVPNHHRAPSLYVNQRDGTFVDEGPNVIFPTSHDAHGAAWADFDNDGDADLLELVDGGSLDQPNFLYQNNGALRLSNVAGTLGVGFPAGRGKTPLWFDYDRDGWLDLLITSHKHVDDPSGHTVLLRNNGKTFDSVNGPTGVMRDLVTNFAMLADLDDQGYPLLLLSENGKFPTTAFDLSILPFLSVDILAEGVAKSAADAAVADFNGDLQPELFIVRGESTSEVVQSAPNVVRAALTAKFGDEHGMRLSTRGVLDLMFQPGWKLRDFSVPILVGAAGRAIAGASFQLDSTDVANHGIAPHQAGVDSAIFIGYDPLVGEWEVALSNVGFRINSVLASESDISGLTSFGVDLDKPPPADLYLVNEDGFLFDRSPAEGAPVSTSGRGIVAADFDNDMDNDVYVISTGAVQNRENVLLLNQGDGTFLQVPGAAGAPGAFEGRADAVAIADYDQDGLMDLLITNGKSKPPFDIGPVQFYRNISRVAGNTNGWLEVDLQGVVSNRDGVGAKLILTTPDGTTQVREQSGGMHSRAQNYARVHLGLDKTPQQPSCKSLGQAERCKPSDPSRVTKLSRSLNLASRHRSESRPINRALTTGFTFGRTARTTPIGCVLARTVAHQISGSC